MADLYALVPLVQSVKKVRSPPSTNICISCNERQLSGTATEGSNDQVGGAKRRGSIANLKAMYGPALRGAALDQISVCSANSKASSISTPRYRTVFSILLCPSRIWIARRFPVAL